LNYSPIDDITFRATRSHDIRAPDLADLFQNRQTSTTSITDPQNAGASATVSQVTSGNPKLQPEAADTTGVGVIVKPSFLSGFEASVDYYQIKINDAIFTATAQQYVNECAQGATAICSQIIRNGAGVVTQVNVQPVNLAEQTARGVDFEASYNKDLAEIAPDLAGDLGLRVLATHYLANTINTGITAPYNTVGDNSSNGTSQLSLPHWRYYASATWNKGPAAVTFVARGISAGEYNTTYIQCTSGCPAYTVAHPTIENNHLPGAIYFDTNISYDLPGNTQVFLAVDNLMNKNPPQVAFGPSIGTAPLSVNPALYDVLGRVFRFGVRFKM
jgi:outer membrane receptor protein involved in Fe transport